MRPICLHDQATIARFLQRNPLLYLYALGDLDPFFWPYTTWYGFEEAGELQEVLLLYSGSELPVLLALSEQPVRLARWLPALHPLLPARLYSHLSEGLLPALAPPYQVQPYGPHLKMALRDPQALTDVESDEVQVLGPEALPALAALYEASYPGNAFDPRMVETGRYYGIWRDDRLVCVAGVHVYSPRYRVAALGNVTTHPASRGQGLSRAACAHLCRTLLAEGIEQVGLNVKADNQPALTLYAQLGFVPIATYGEFLLVL